MCVFACVVYWYARHTRNFASICCILLWLFLFLFFLLLKILRFIFLSVETALWCLRPLRHRRRKDRIYPKVHPECTFLNYLYSSKSEIVDSLRVSVHFIYLCCSPSGILMCALSGSSSNCVCLPCSFYSCIANLIFKICTWKIHKHLYVSPKSNQASTMLSLNAHDGWRCKCLLNSRSCLFDANRYLYWKGTIAEQQRK